MVDMGRAGFNYETAGEEIVENSRLPGIVCPTIVLYDHGYFVDGDRRQKLSISNRGKVI